MNIEKILRKHSKKATPERLDLFAWMEKKHLFTSANLESEFSHIGRASIFRTLKLFVELWVLRRVNLWEMWESYEIECCRKHHHEHMKCSSCGDILSFKSDNICSRIFSEAKKLGFHISEHSLSIFGTCKNCIH